MRAPARYLNHSRAKSRRQGLVMWTESRQRNLSFFLRRSAGIPISAVRFGREFPGLQGLMGVGRFDVGVDEG